MNIRYKIKIVVFTMLTFVFTACSEDKVDTSKTTQTKNETVISKVADKPKKDSSNVVVNRPNKISNKTKDILESSSEIFTLNIIFEKMSYEIKPEYEKDIRKFADYLIKYPTYKAEIKAYTDSYGSQKYNLMISKKRAKSVYEKLLEFNIDSKRMSHEGFGKKFPKVSNDTKSGRAKNRRVEVVVIK